jgi:hypothetical protein
MPRKCERILGLGTWLPVGLLLMIADLIKQIFADPEGTGEKGVRWWRYTVANNGGPLWALLWLITGIGGYTALKGELAPGFTTNASVVGVVIIGAMLLIASAKFLLTRPLVKSRLDKVLADQKAAQEQAIETLERNVKTVTEAATATQARLSEEHRKDLVEKQKSHDAYAREILADRDAKVKDAEKGRDAKLEDARKDKAKCIEDQVQKFEAKFQELDAATKGQVNKLKSEHTVAIKSYQNIIVEVREENARVMAELKEAHNQYMSVLKERDECRADMKRTITEAEQLAVKVKHYSGTVPLIAHPIAAVVSHSVLQVRFALIGFRALFGDGPIGVGPAFRISISPGLTDGQVSFMPEKALPLVVNLEKDADPTVAFSFQIPGYGSEVGARISQHPQSMTALFVGELLVDIGTSKVKVPVAPVNIGLGGGSMQDAPKY